MRELWRDRYRVWLLHREVRPRLLRRRGRHPPSTCDSVDCHGTAPPTCALPSQALHPISQSLPMCWYPACASTTPLEPNLNNGFSRSLRARSRLPFASTIHFRTFCQNTLRTCASPTLLGQCKGHGFLCFQNVSPWNATFEEPTPWQKVLPRDNSDTSSAGEAEPLCNGTRGTELAIYQACTSILYRVCYDPPR